MYKCILVRSFCFIIFQHTLVLALNATEPLPDFWQIILTLAIRANVENSVAQDGCIRVPNLAGVACNSEFNRAC